MLKKAWITNWSDNGLYSLSLASESADNRLGIWETTWPANGPEAEKNHTVVIGPMRIEDMYEIAQTIFKKIKEEDLRG